MRSRESKRVVTIVLVIFTVIILTGMQPMFFGVRTFFGVNALAILLPLSALFMVAAGFHLYQVWPLLRFWFKKSPDPGKQRDKLKRITVLVLFVVILSYDIASAWYFALTYGIDGMPMQTIRAWSWVATALLAVHVWQRWRLTVSYFRRRPRRDQAGT